MRINKLFNSLFPYRKSGALKQVSGSFIVQILFAGISFFTASILARLFGVTNYGAYSNAMAWVNMLATLSVFGLNSLLLREIAILKIENNWTLIKGLIQFSDKIALFISLLLLIGLISFSGILYPPPNKDGLRTALILSSTLIPVFTLINLRQHAMRGLNHVTYALLPDLIIRPGLILFFILAISFFAPSYIINVHTTIAIVMIVSVFSFFISDKWLKKFLPTDSKLIQPSSEIEKWFFAGKIIFTINSTQIIITQAPTIFLGMLSSVNDISFFSVATRLSSLLIFLPLSLGLVIGPRIAQLYALGEQKKIETMIKKASRTSFLFTLFFFSFFALFPKNALSIFGKEYIDASYSLIMLSIGYLVDSAMGMSINTLMMTGNEKTLAMCQILFTVFLILFCLILIPLFGHKGAATAFTITMIISRITLAFVAKAKTTINTTMF